MNIAVLLKYKIFHKILKSEFNKNVLILAGGTAIAKAIPIAISPILKRLYSSKERLYKIPCQGYIFIFKF